MRSIKMIGVAIVAMLALGAVTASGAYAAEEFVASKAGKLVGHQASSKGEQVFTTPHGNVTCTELTASGEVKEGELKKTSEAVKVLYKSCTAFGIAKAEISEANYTFFAKLPATVSILVKPIIIKATGCEIEVGSGQTDGGKSGELVYSNESGRIALETAIKNISYEVKKSTLGICGTVGEKGTTATYTGNSYLELEGGTLEDPTP